MSKRGRFGKYGENKRYERLRKSRRASNLYQKSGPKPLRNSQHLHPKDIRGRVKLQHANPSDAHFIEQLSDKAFRVYGPYGSLISQWFESGLTFTLIAFLKQKPVGFAMMGSVSKGACPGHMGELLAIAVESGSRKRGIGTLLLKGVERKAAEWGVTRIGLHTAVDNIPARNLFEKNGYRIYGTRRRFYPAGQDAYKLIKEIGQTGDQIK